MDSLELAVSTQTSLLGLNRSELYYRPVPPSADDLSIKLHIDKIYTSHPEYGYQRICWWLNNKEHTHIKHKAVLKHIKH